MLRTIRWRFRLRAFLFGLTLIRWALKNKDLDAEITRMLKYQELLGTIEGFVAASPADHAMMKGKNDA